MPTAKPIWNRDDEILRTIQAHPEAVEEFLSEEDICDHGTLTHDELVTIGSLMYEDGDLWAAHAVSMKKALDAVRPDVRLPRKMRVAFDHALQAILDDIAEGSVPPDVPTFSALHDSVDANTYLIDAAEKAGIDWGDAEDGPSPDHLDPLNVLADRLDEALRARVGLPPEALDTEHDRFGRPLTPPTVEVVDIDAPLPRHTLCGDIVESHEYGDLVCKSCGLVPDDEVQVVDPNTAPTGRDPITGAMTDKGHDDEGRWG